VPPPEHVCGSTSFTVTGRLALGFPLGPHMWNTPPPSGTEAERGEAEVFAEHARRVGWAPPLAYDEDEIDAEDGGPVAGWRRTERATVPSADRADDVRFLREHGGYEVATDRELAMRLGVPVDTLQQALRRDGRHQGAEVAS
jgi:hypothetical protein